MVGHDPPLRLFDAPPVTRVLSSKPVSESEAESFLSSFIQAADGDLTWDQKSRFTQEDMVLPFTFTTAEESHIAEATGTMAMLKLVSRGLNGEDATEEAKELFRLLAEQRRKKVQAADDGFVWEEKSVLEEKDDDEVGAWASMEVDNGKMVDHVPQVIDTTNGFHEEESQEFTTEDA